MKKVEKCFAKREKSAQKADFGGVCGCVMSAQGPKMAVMAKNGQKMGILGVWYGQKWSKMGPHSSLGGIFHVFKSFVKN